MSPASMPSQKERQSALFSFKMEKAQVTQRPGASCFATAVRTLTTGSHATGRAPADDPLPVLVRLVNRKPAKKPANP